MCVCIRTLYDQALDSIKKDLLHMPAQLHELYASYCSESAWACVDKCVRKKIAVNWVMAMKSARWTPEMVKMMDSAAHTHSEKASSRLVDGHVCRDLHQMRFIVR